MDLTRNLNKKNCEIDSASRKAVVQAFEAYRDRPISRVLDIDELLYNDVEIEVHRHDEEGRAVQEPFELDFDELEIQLDDRRITTSLGVLNDVADISQNPAAAAARINDWVKSCDSVHLIASDGNKWSWDAETRKLTGFGGAGPERLGLGRVTVKAKASKTKKGEFVKVLAMIGPLFEKDHESTKFSSDLAANERLIENFLSCWVREPRRRLGQKVGCEVNFNRIFPKRADIPSSEQLAKEPSVLAREMTALQQELEAVSVRGRALAASDAKRRCCGWPLCRKVGSTPGSRTLLTSRV